MLTGLLGAAGAAALTGCNKGSRGSAAGVLNVWSGVPVDSGPDKLIAAFEQEHPEITVKYTRYVNNDDGNLKLDTSLQGGVPIDVFFSYGAPALAKRSGAGLTLDLTDKIKSDPDLAKFRADAVPLNNYVFDGSIQCLPGSFGPMFVYLNESKLATAGIKLGESWTVDEFKEVAQKLTVKGKTFGSFNAPAIARPKLGADCLYADNGAKSNFGAPEWQQEIGLAKSMQHEASTMPREQVLAENLKTFSQTPFLTGQTAMMIGFGHLTRYIADPEEYPHDFKTICMPPPNPNPGGDDYWNEGAIGDLMSISQQSENQDAAWTFVKFWMMNGGKYTGRLPNVVGDATPAELTAKFLGPNRDTFFDTESFERFLFHSDLQVTVDTIFTAATQIDQIKEKLTDELLLGDLTLDSWVTKAVTQSNAAITSAS